jgi:hypothetical protein
MWVTTELQTRLSWELWQRARPCPLWGGLGSSNKNQPSLIHDLSPQFQSESRFNGTVILSVSPFRCQSYSILPPS